MNLVAYHMTFRGWRSKCLLIVLLLYVFLLVISRLFLSSMTSNRENNHRTSIATLQPAVKQSRRQLDGERLVKIRNILELLLQSELGDVTEIDMADDPQRVVLHYPPFNVTPPRFASSEDAKTFHAHPLNRQGGRSPEAARRTGVLSLIDQGVVSPSYDCGAYTDLRQFSPVQNLSLPDNVHRRTTQRYEAETDVLKSTTVCALLVPDGWSFQHFIDGVLPKIVQVLHLVKHLNIKLLLYKPRDPIISEILVKLGLTKGDIVYIEDLPLGYTDILRLPHQLNSCITPPLHPVLWRLARKEIGMSVTEKSERNLVIFMPRRKTRNLGRRIQNEEDVIQYLLRRYGRDLHIHTSGLGLSETLRLFGRATILIGVHGGALYNHLFAPDDVSVVEIMPTGNDGTLPNGLATTIFWQMSSLLSQRYWRISAKPLNSVHDVNVPMNKLKQTLDSVHFSNVKSS